MFFGLKRILSSRRPHFHSRVISTFGKKLPMQPDSPSTHRLEIMKALFARQPNGGYAIRHALVVPIKPRAEGPDAFYAINDDIIGAQPNYISTIVTTLSQSIVPIVAVLRSENRMVCLGTGFFVSVTGLMITAAHVVMDPIERQYDGVRQLDDSHWDIRDLDLGVMIRMSPVFGEPGWMFRKIEWASLLAEWTDSPLPFGRRDLKLTTDTAICQVEALPGDACFQPLAMVQPGLLGVGLAEGKSAVAIGYGAMQDVALVEVGEGVREGDFFFDLYASTGHVVERFPDNLANPQVRTPGPCFSASLKLPGGMSGSPIFDDERLYVHGVVSSGVEGANGPDGFGYASMLAPSLHIPIKPLGDRPLVDLIGDQQFGILRLNIPDA